MVYSRIFGDCLITGWAGVGQGIFITLSDPILPLDMSNRNACSSPTRYTKPYKVQSPQGQGAWPPRTHALTSRLCSGDLVSEPSSCCSRSLLQDLGYIVLSLM